VGRRTGGDLDVAQVDAGVEHRGHEGVPEHVRVHAGQFHASVLGEPA
jgi:pantoate kinase